MRLDPLPSRMTADVVDCGALIEAQSGSAYARWILVFAALAMTIEGYDVQLLAYAAPAIIRDWHLEKAMFGPIFGAALFGYLLGATLLSGLSDRFGRKRVIVAGNLFFGLLTIASGFAPNVMTLLVLRFVAGLGLGSSIPAVMALGVEYAPQSRRAFRVSLLFIGYTLGGALGGIVAAGLMVRFGWPSAFFFGGCASILLGLTSLFGLPESVRFLVLLGGREREVGSILRRLKPDLALSSATRFAVSDEEVAKGMPVRQLFTQGRARMTIVLWIAFVTSLMGHHFLTSWLPTVLDSAGVPMAHAVIAGSLIQGGGALGSLIVGRLTDRIGLVAIIGAYVLSIVFVIAIGAGELSEAPLMLVVFIAGMCLLGGQVGLNGLAATIYPTAVRSSGAGWALGVGRIGSILGPVIGGLLIAANLSMSALFCCAAVPAAFCAVAVTALRRYLPQPARTEVAIADRSAEPIETYAPE